MTRHTCHAIGCNVQVAPKFLMCGKHWAMVPRMIQRAVWATYRPGQENDKRPSHAYMVNHYAAAIAVAEKEGREQDPECQRARAMQQEHFRLAEDGGEIATPDAQASLPL